MAELSKIKKSESSGAGFADVYVPKLWCFDALHFLQQGATVVAKGESNLPELPFSQSQCGSSRVEVEVENSEDEIIFEGDAEDFSNLEVLSPPTVFKKILGKTSSSARASGSCEDSAPPTKKSKKQEKTEAHGLISEAVTSLKELRADYRIESDDIPNLSGNMAFAQWVGKEMDLIDDDEILNDLQESISQSLFKAKRKLFRNKQSD